jgi:SnoaL-like domain
VPPMTDTETLINRYIDIWNEADPGRRRELIAQTWTEDATYVDPMLTGFGHDGIAAMIAGARERFPGHRFELAGTPDAHHDRVRFTWHLKPQSGGDAVAIGSDFGVVADDGRLSSVTGFLDLVP